MGLKKDRPKITRSNFVCAEPMPGEEPAAPHFPSWATGTPRASASSRTLAWIFASFAGPIRISCFWAGLRLSRESSAYA